MTTPDKSRTVHKLTDAHREYILRRYGEFQTSCTVVRSELQDKQIAEDNGFDPVKIARQTVHWYMNGDEWAERRETARQAYLAAMRKKPLWHKEMRVNELVANLNEIKASERDDKFELILKYLKEIREEIGGHQATDSGGVTVNVWNDISDEQRSQQRVNASTFYERLRDSNRFSG